MWAGGHVGRWVGGHVVRWACVPGGQVVMCTRWSGGHVDRWSCGQVGRSVTNTVPVAHRSAVYIGKTNAISYDETLTPVGITLVMIM